MRQRAKWLPEAMLVVGTIVMRLPVLTYARSLDDEHVYGLVAHEMAHGGLPYVAAIERKPPLLFWLYDAIFRAFGHCNWQAIHLVSVLWTVATLAGIYRIGTDLFGRREGLAAALLASVFSTWGLFPLLAFNGELIMNGPLVWAAWLLVRPAGTRSTLGLLAAGALIAVAFLLKQPAAIAALPLGLHVLLARPPGERARPASLARLATFAAGMLAVLGSMGLVLHRLGIFDDAWFWTITNHDVPHGPMSLVYWQRFLQVGAIYAAGLAPVLVLARTSWRAREFWRGRRAERWALGGLVFCSLVGASYSGRFYPHYFLQITPWLCVLAGPALAACWRTPRTSRFVGLIILGYAALYLGINTAGRLLAREWQASLWLQAHARPEDRIFVWGQRAEIYTETGLRPASRYITTFPLTGYIFGSPLSLDPTHDTDDRIVPGAWALLAADLAREPPCFIVDTDAGLPAPRYPPARYPLLAHLLATAYVPVAALPDAVIHERVPSCAAAPKREQSEEFDVP